MEFGFQDTTETMAFISNIPFVKKLIKQNVKLQKKNKELKQLIKLITKNFDLFQHEEKLEIVGKPIKLEKTDLDVTELDDEVLVVEPPTNIKYEVHEIESDDTDVVNTSCYDTYERPVESCFDAILNSVKTIEDFNKLTNLNIDDWIQMVKYLEGKRSRMKPGTSFSIVLWVHPFFSGLVCGLFWGCLGSVPGSLGGCSGFVWGSFRG